MAATVNVMSDKVDATYLDKIFNATPIELVQGVAAVDGSGFPGPLEDVLRDSVRHEVSKALLEGCRASI